MTARTVIYHELDRLCRSHGFDRVAEGFDAIRHSYRPVDFDPAFTSRAAKRAVNEVVEQNTLTLSHAEWREAVKIAYKTIHQDGGDLNDGKLAVRQAIAGDNPMQEG